MNSGPVKTCIMAGCMARRQVVRLIGIGVAIAAIVTAALTLPLARYVLALVEWMRNQGALGVAVYAAVYVIATVLALPGAAVTLAAGFVYGPLWGTALVSPASVAGATCAFAIARFIARDFVAERVRRHPRFAAIDEAVGERGWEIVFLLRLSPIVPFNFLNYALGLTRVRTRDYVVASAIGMLPGTFLYVYLGSLITSAAELLRGHRPSTGPWGQVLFWAGLAATILVTAVITRRTRRVLDRKLAQAQR